MRISLSELRLGSTVEPRFKAVIPDHLKFGDAGLNNFHFVHGDAEIVGSNFSDDREWALADNCLDAFQIVLREANNNARRRFSEQQSLARKSIRFQLHRGTSYFTA